MRFFFNTPTVAVLLGASAVLAIEEDPKNRPVSKVINVLKDMREQLEKEQKADEEVYDKMACWCETNDKAKTKAIAEAEEKITALTSEIEELAATDARLATEIENLEKEIAQKQQSLEEATSIRQKELATFNEEEKDMLQSISALKSAITVLSKHHAPPAALINIATLVRRTLFRRSPKEFGLTTAQAQTLDAFVQTQGKNAINKDYWDAAPVGAGSYNAQSGEIFGILKQMLDTFQADLAESQKAEADKAKAFTELKAALEQEITDATESKESKTDEKAKTVQSLQIAKDDLEDTRETLSADQKFLMNLKQQCQATDQEWEERQKTRADELKAISEAITILGSDDAHDLFTSTFNKSASLLQLVASKKSSTFDLREKAAKFLVGTKDPKLAALAVSVRLDAFTKVKKAIDDMIADLTAQQADELKKRDWCVSALNENEKAHIQKTHEKETLTDEIAHLSSEIERLASEITQHEANIADLVAQTKRAGEDREKENIEFQNIVREQTQTLEILQKAIAVLARVYKTDEEKAAAGSSLISIRAHQEPAGPPPPQGFDNYEKKQGGGVIGMLNQIVADTEALKKEAIVAEANAQKAYEQFVQDANDSKSAEEKAVVSKSAQKAELAKTKEADETSLTEVEGELVRVGNENADLHTQCDYLLKNFDLRQEARGQEIEALNTAKSILSGAKFSEFIQKN